MNEAFVSYAQNFEDVILMRALSKVGNGFYIDIGANDPRVHSVSLAFYEKGWRGIHVEPMPSYAKALRSARPDEIVIQAVVSSSDEPVILHEFEGTGLTTAIDAYADQHLIAGFEKKELKAHPLSLEKILAPYEETDIHWLKVDVEGAEGDVLASWGESPARPWILVIESTRPSSRTESFKEWESEVTSRGYKFVYFDGLNRFYIHKSRNSLSKHFKIGPNLWDNFLVSEDSSFAQHLKRKIQHLNEELQERTRKLETTQKQLTDTCAQLESRDAQLEAERSALGKVQAELRHVQEALESRNVELREKSDQLEESRKQLASTYEQLESKDTQLRDKAHRLEETQEQLAGAYAELESRDSQLLEKAYRLEEVEVQLAAAQAELKSKSAQVHDNLLQLEDTQRQLEKLREEHELRDRKLKVIKRSKSWRMTAPFRGFTERMTFRATRASANDHAKTDQAARFPLWWRVILKPSGKPRKPIRKLLFKPNGKPRGKYRFLVVSKGQPRPIFRRWMANPRYLKLPRAERFEPFAAHASKTPISHSPNTAQDTEQDTEAEVQPLSEDMACSVEFDHRALSPQAVRILRRLKASRMTQANSK